MHLSEIKQLLNTGTFQGKPLKGKLIETHISWVILTKDYAFKIKKPIKYNFLDFSTQEKRMHYCNREVELNSRLTNIYLDVQPIITGQGSISIGLGDGETIGHAVRMKRMDTAKEMDKMLIANKVDRTHVQRIAEKVAGFHAGAQVIKTPFNRALCMETFNDIESVKPFIRDALGVTQSEIIEDVIEWSNTFLKEHEGLIKQRIQDGFQRDCHGDLHSKNIFLYNEPVIFDCIEFNDGFRQIDVLNEIAFFCMDLDAYGMPDLGEAFLSKYLLLFPCCKGDEEVQLLNYYKCLRANIRAKVNALRAMQANKKSKKNVQIAEVNKYLKLMREYRSIR